MNKINNLTDFYKFMEGIGSSSENLIFRGVKKESYKLISSIGRFKTNKKEEITIDDEKLILKLFKQKAYPFVKEHIESDVELLSIAQHHGLPTRLLDWTKNPLVAMYFAVYEGFTQDEACENSLIYQYNLKHKVDLDKEFQPFDIDEIKRFIPRHWSPRIVAQSGLFTVHPDPMVPYESEDITQITINHRIRKDIKTALNRLGVNHAVLFPDLDGISAYIKYLRTDAF